MATKYINFRQEVICVGKPLIANSSLDTTTGFAPRTEATYGPFGSIQDAIDSLNVIFPDGLDTIPMGVLVCIVTDAEYDNDGYLTSGTLNEYRLEYLISNSLTTSSWDTYFKPYGQSGGITEDEVDTKIQTAISGEENRANDAYANKATQNSVNGNIIVTSNRKIYRSSNGTLPNVGENVFIYDDDTMNNQPGELTTMDIENVLGYPAVGYEFRRQQGASSADDYRVEAFKNVNFTKNDIWIGTASQYRSALLFRSDEIANKTLIIITSDGSGVVNVSGENIVVPSRPITQNGE